MELIKKIKQAEAKAQEISMRAPLTSLSNRRRFDDSLGRELADARQQGTTLSLVLADIDNFKKVNDLFGHTIGDEILKTFARVLQDNVWGGIQGEETKNPAGGGRAFCVYDGRRKNRV